MPTQESCNALWLWRTLSKSHCFTHMYIWLENRLYAYLAIDWVWLSFQFASNAPPKYGLFILLLIKIFNHKSFFDSVTNITKQI